MAGVPEFETFQISVELGRRTIVNVGLQLYTTRRLGGLQQQLLMAQQVGYRHVETVGFHDMAVKDVVDSCAAFQLKVTSAHFDWPEFETRFQDILWFLEASGCQVVVMPWLPQSDRPSTRAGWGQLIRTMRIWAKDLADIGVRFAYHNHDYELRPLDGTTALDLILKEPLIYWQPDVGWLAHSGEDVGFWLRRYATKITSIHAKDIAPGAGRGDEVWRDLGDGVLDWADIITSLEACENVDLFVEHDESSDYHRTLTSGFTVLNRALGARNCAVVS
tara:strand:+ start:243 stop:1070 length:828 start_codon:yes stop_codon:yes gene_type:complete